MFLPPRALPGTGPPWGRDVPALLPSSSVPPASLTSATQPTCPTARSGALCSPGLAKDVPPPRTQGAIAVIPAQRAGVPTRAVKWPFDKTRTHAHGHGAWEAVSSQPSPVAMASANRPGGLVGKGVPHRAAPHWLGWEVPIL